MVVMLARVQGHGTQSPYAQLVSTEQAVGDPVSTQPPETYVLPAQQHMCTKSRTTKKGSTKQQKGVTADGK